MADRWHQIGANSLCRMPNRVICLGVVLGRREDASDPAGYVECFARAHASLWVGRKGVLRWRDGVETESSGYLWDWLAARTSRTSRTYIFVQDAGQCLVASGFLASDTTTGISLVDYTIEGPPTIFWATIKGRSLVVVSICNYSPRSLSEICSDYGMPTPDTYARHTTSEYLQSQGTLILTCMQRYVLALIGSLKTSDVGNFPLTTSSLAWNSYRHRLMGSRPVCHNINEALEVETAAYYGGQCHAYFRGHYGHSVYEIDCNSLYPYAMSSYPMPRRLLGVRTKADVAVLRGKISDNICCARVRICSETECYPVRVKYRTRYCAGMYWTALCGEELKMALARGHIADCSWLAWYEPADIFGKYVAYWYAARRECVDAGDMLGESICKSVLNSLYGRFAKRNKKWTATPRLDNIHDYGEHGWYDAKSKRWTTARWVRGCCQIAGDRQLDQDACPIISACVTAAARIYMGGIRDVAGRENVYGVHTDALLLNEQGLDRLTGSGFVDNRKLGAFKISSSGDSMYIEGSGLYAIGSECVRAGSARRSILAANDSVTTVGPITVRRIVQSCPPLDIGHSRRVATPTVLLCPDTSRQGEWLDIPKLFG